MTPDGDIRYYSDIDDVTGHYAGALQSLGLQAGERLLAQVDKSPEAVSYTPLTLPTPPYM